MKYELKPNNLKLNTLKPNALTLCFSSLLFLSACGGGGGSNATTIETDPNEEVVVETPPAPQVETPTTNPENPPVEINDTDGDGIANETDTDDDGDGVDDINDAFPLNETETVDTDGDGIGNNADLDDDNDGVNDTNDDLPLNASETVDTDGDGIGNNADLDDDGDGVSDIDEELVGFDPLDESSFPRPFIITVDTRLNSSVSTSDVQFMVPIIAGNVQYNYAVDCDSDGPMQVATNQTSFFLCDYTEPGIYTVSISGIYPQINFGSSAGANEDSVKLLKIEQWGTNKWVSMEGAFAGCENMTYRATDTPDLSNVTDLSSMFDRAKAFDGAIGDWDVSSVTDMGAMFIDATSFNQNIGQWKVSSVTNMSDMFNGASSFNQDIGQWEMGSVTDIKFMFRETSAFNQDISQWDVSSVANMEFMFALAPSFNQDIGQWDVSSVTNMEFMFLGTSLSSENYDNLLLGWHNGALNDLNEGVVFNAGNSETGSDNARNARAKLVGTFGWSITDGDGIFE